MTEKIFVKNTVLKGFRGLNGRIALGRGINVVMGPNSSGKTAVLEGIAHAIAFNYTDLRISNGLLLIMHAARGSEKHSLASIMPYSSNTAEVCVNINDQDGCINVVKNARVESGGLQLIPVVDIVFNSKMRDCVLTYSILLDGISIRAEGHECFSEKLGVKLGVLTPGVLPYNFYDSLIGELKRREPRLVGKMAIKISGHSYGVDVAADDWNSLSVHILEDEEKLISFYSIGRGLQRAFLLRTLLATMNIVLIDEVESAMHPELLAEMATWIAEAARDGKQIVLTTQSIEAARFIVAAVIGAEREGFWRRSELIEEINEKCSGEQDVFSDKLSLLTLHKEGDEIRSLKLDGCHAIRQIMSTSDPRLAYTLI